MLVYIHVPFCTSKCNYCAFYSKPFVHNKEEEGNRALYLRGYLDALLMEIALWSDRLGQREVSTVFFGGGTPSLLPPKSIGIVLDRLHKAFKVLPNAEISLEANPESLSNVQIAREFLATGINRVSLGVQSLDDNVLSILGRCHKVIDAKRAYRALRQAYCNNINLDLMWGLPTQKIQDWRANLKEIAFMAPDHISMYGLSLEPGTSLANDVEAGQYVLPEEKIQSYMYLQGAEILEDASLMQYEISNFSKMGLQCKHNLGYWDGEDYLGFGPSATSTVAGRRWTNPLDFGDWGRLVTSKIAPEAAELSPKEKLLEYMMLRLRTSRGFRLKAYQEFTGHSFVRAHSRLVEAMHHHGFIRIQHGYMRLTRQGFLLSNSILAAIFDALDGVSIKSLPSQGASHEPSQGPLQEL